ncbi:MAG: hypothetical protein HWD85_12540 [Flavobacteriaceae bacterium]|nr:hypothetical protein [Flavobacteriaceae bacterium]
MAFLTRNEVKKIVKAALEEVAGTITGDIEEFPNQDFKAMNNILKNRFLDTLKSQMNNHEFYDYDDDGNRVVIDGWYYDVALSILEMDNWSGVTACIDYVDEYQREERKN